MNIRSSHPEVFFEKGVLKICSKFTGEYPCRIPMPKCDFNIVSKHKKTSGGLLLENLDRCYVTFLSI